MGDVRTVLAIVGPTATGKTPLSLQLSDLLSAEIISADSRQIYKYLDIGTAKPDKESLERVRHHFIDILDPREDYSAGQYGREARDRINQVLSSGKTPLLVGGSGLYVKAVVDGLFDGPGRDEEIRARLEQDLKEKGIGEMLRRLRDADPVSAATMEKEPKARRILRALEVHAITGVPLSEFHREQETSASFRVVFFGLNREREELYRLIDKRVERMVAFGLFDEVESLQARGYSPASNSLNTVGYREVFSYLDGKTSRDESIALIKQNTRRFAKRQLTWFRRDKRIRWISVGNNNRMEDVARRVHEEYLRKAE